MEDSNCWVSATFDTNTIRFCAVGVRCFSEVGQCNSPTARTSLFLPQIMCLIC